MWSPHVILQINTPLNTIFWELNLSSMLLLWLSIFSIILICFSLVPAGLMKVPDDQKKKKMTDFSPYYTSMKGLKITIFSLCLGLSIHPCVKSLYISFPLLFLFLFLENSSLKELLVVFLS